MAGGGAGHERLEVTGPSPLERLLSAEARKGKDPPQTFAPPPSSLLSRAAAFLPRMAEANVRLAADAAAAPPGAFDVEAVVEGEAHVEMDIACGVLDLKDAGAVALAERALVAGGGVDEGGPGDGEQGESGSSSEDEETSEVKEHENGEDEQAEGGGEGDKSQPREQDKAGGAGSCRRSARPKRRRAGIEEL